MTQQGGGVLNSLAWKASERGLVQGLNLIVQIILARLLLPQDFACLAIINAIIGYLGLFVQSGLSIAVVQKKELSKIDIATLTSISLLIALILFTGLFFVAPLISNYYNVGDLTWPIRVMALSLFLYSFNSIQTGLLTRKMMFRAMFFRSLLATPISGIVGIVMAYKGFGVWALIAYNITNILCIVFFMNMIPDLRLSLGFSRKSAKDLYSFSIKILCTSLVSSSGDTIRTLVIGKTYTPEKLGYYDRGLSYSNLVTQIVNASLSSVLLPVFSRSQDDKEHVREMARRSVCMSAFVMIPMLVLVAIMAKPLVLILFTEKWIPCAQFLSIFCILRIFGIITTTDKQVYYALGNSNIALCYEIIFLIANLLSLVLMIPYGPFYIAIGCTVVEFFGTLVLCIVSSKVYGYTLVNRIKDLSKPIINTFVMFIACYTLTYIIPNGKWILLLSQIAIAFVVYVFMAIVTKDSNFLYIKRMMLSQLKKNK